MFQAKIVRIGDKKYHATTRHGSFDLASDGTSSKPADVLLASLCACLGHYVAEYLQQQNIRFSDVTLCAESALVADRSRLGDIRVTIEISNATLDDAAKAGMMQYVTQCYIYGTLKANSAVFIEVATQ
jgi:uncharacterized OsmC-like protein